MLAALEDLLHLYFQLASSLDSAIYFPAWISCMVSCAFIKWGPVRLRPFFAVPNALAFALCLALGFFGRPDLYLIASMNFCPLLLWLAKIHAQDPMRLILLDEPST